MNNELRHARAKYEAECPLCLDWIHVGRLIVQGEDGLWCHAVCPRDLKARYAPPAEPCKRQSIRESE